MERIRARSRPTETHCPFCHGGFSDEEQVVACGGCAIVYHQDCLRDELRSCASLGCEVRPELGKAFRWGDREQAAGALTRQLTCCDGKGFTPGGIRVCQGCGGLLHEHCLARREPCCPTAETAPLLQRARPEWAGLLSKLLVSWGLLGVLAFYWAGGLLRESELSAHLVGLCSVLLLIYLGVASLLLAARFQRLPWQREPVQAEGAASVHGYVSIPLAAEESER